MTDKEAEAPSAGVSREVYCVLWGVDSVCMRMSALQWKYKSMLETIHPRFLAMCAHTKGRKRERTRKRERNIVVYGEKEGERNTYTFMMKQYTFMMCSVSPTCGRMCVTRLFWPQCYEQEQNIGLVIVCVRERESEREKERFLLLSGLTPLVYTAVRY